MQATKIIFSLMILSSGIAMGQNTGTITIRKPAASPCDDCFRAASFTGTAGMIVKLLINDNFKQKEIKCYRISIYKNDSLVACMPAKIDTGNVFRFIPPGRYNVSAFADDYVVTIGNVYVAERKMVYLNMEFSDTKKPKGKTRKSKRK